MGRARGKTIPSKCKSYRLNNLIHIILNFVIRKTDHPVTKILKRLLSFFVLCFPANMHTPIDLDDQSPAPAAEIDHVRTNRLLSVKLIAI